MQRDVAVFVGSLRKESHTRKVAQGLASVAPASLALEIVDIGQLPMYNEDLETESPPVAWTALRERVKAADALLFVTPEYNRSVPAVLKNAIDVGSRPGGKGVWSGKPGAVVSVTPYQLGAFGANHHLRQALVYVNVPTMQQPEAYISNAATIFDDKGGFVNPATKQFFEKIMTAFARWTEVIVAGG